MERINIQNSRTGVSTLNGAQVNNTTSSSTGNGAQDQGRELDVYSASHEQGWLTQSLEEWDWSNAKRYKNYLAVVKRDEQGEYKYTWQRESDNSDEFFSLKGVKVGDVLMAGCKYTRKGRTLAKAYYYVVYVGEEKIRIVRNTTYLKAIKDGEEYIRRREERMAAKAAEEAAKAAEEAAKETAAKETVEEQPMSRLDQMRQAFDESLTEAGDNPLNLAYALAEAIEHTSGPVTQENIEEQALWLAYRRQLESRLESLNGGAGMTTPCLENAAEKSSNNNGNPAPGLKYGDIVQSCTGDVYVFRGFYGGCMMLEENGGGGMFTAALRNGQWSIQWEDMYETLYL